MNRSTLAGAVLLLLSFAGLWVDARMFLAAWLSAWWWCLGLVLGALVNLWMHRLTGGAWGVVLRPVVALLVRRLPWLLLLFIPVAAGLSRLYPWAADPNGAWTTGIARPAFLHAWLSPAFFFARLAVYALVWCWLARGVTALSSGRAARALLAHALVTSLASVDLLMSLMPGWYSTAFGLVTMSAQALGGAALAILFLVRHAPAVAAAHEHGKPPVWRDLGNLLMMWCMTWAYIAFMQFLIVWAENLPREIAWYLPRVQTGWWWVAVALVLGQLALPLVALLFRSVKDQPARLAWVAAGLLAATALDTVWMVVPSVAPHSWQGWWLLPMCFAGMGLLAFGALPRELRGLERGHAARETAHAGA